MQATKDSTKLTNDELTKEILKLRKKRNMLTQKRKNLELTEQEKSGVRAPIEMNADEKQVRKELIKLQDRLSTRKRREKLIKD